MSICSRKYLAPAAAGLLLTLGASRAGATPDMPARLAEVVEMPCVPTCNACHTVKSGGPLNQAPFLFVLQNAGLRPWEPDTLTNELIDLVRNPVDNGFDAVCIAIAMPEGSIAPDGQCDTDGDGTGDITALEMGMSPSDGSDLCNPVSYGYGNCALVTPAPIERDLGGPTALLGALGALALFVRRRRRRP